MPLKKHLTTSELTRWFRLNSITHGEDTSLGNSGYLLFPFADYVSPFMQIILFVTGIVQFICGFGLIFYESPATKILCAWILAAILIVIDSAVINLPVSIEDAPRAHEWN